MAGLMCEVGPGITKQYVAVYPSCSLPSFSAFGGQVGDSYRPPNKETPAKLIDDTRMCAE